MRTHRLAEVDRQKKLILNVTMQPEGAPFESRFMPEAEALAAGYTLAPRIDPVPVAVPAWALQAVLEERGKLDGLQAAIDSMTGPTGRKVQWIFKRGDLFERDGDTVNSLGAAIGYTPSQVDDLFISAAKLANS